MDTEIPVWNTFLQTPKIVLKEKSQKNSQTIIKSQNLPNLQNLDEDLQKSHFEWILHNGRRKVHIGYRSDTKNYNL